MYFFGEPGYEAEYKSHSLHDALESAKEYSAPLTCTAIAVWNEEDEFIAIALNGELFMKEDNS